MKIHPDIVETVKREFTDDWLVKLCTRINETDPVLFEFLKSIEQKIGTIGLGYVLLVYRIVETQLEVDELNDSN